ncbi:unnamed protein product [Linum trigynum]|uniref:Uncharacterized protein n=1 Tax=Linum trigynum TaxID=586398 RepID=A0AAV2ENK8_9ROSI
MPVSGKEESGVKPFARQPSFDISGVPIKKRRFFRHPSPTPEEQPSSVSPKNGSIQPVSSTYGSAPLNPKFAGSASGLSDATKKIPDTAIPTSVNNSSLVKSEASCGEVISDSLAPLGSENKPVEAEALDKISVIPATNELKSAPVPPNPGEVTVKKQVPAGKCKPGVSAVSGNLELSLGLKEHHVADSNDGSSHRQGNEESISLNISSSKAGTSTQCKKDDMKLTSDGGSKSADRLNWDLNTTMDAWEGPLDDKSAGKITDNELKSAGARPDKKPLICPTNANSIAVSDAKNVLEKSVKPLSSSGTVSQSATQHNLDSSLHLCLSPSFLSFSVSEEPSCSVSNKDPCKVFPNASLPKGLSSAGKSGISKPKNVKQEPRDEGTRPVFNIPPSVVNGPVKRELMEKLAQEVLKSGCYSSLKIIGPRSIKYESCQEGNQEMLKVVEGKCQQPGIEESPRIDEDITQQSGEVQMKNEIDLLSHKSGAAEDLKTAVGVSQQSGKTEALNGLEEESPKLANPDMSEVVGGTAKQSDKLQESQRVDRMMEQFDKVEGALNCPGNDILDQSERQESSGAQPDKLEVIMEQSDNRESLSLEMKEQTGCSINNQESYNQNAQWGKQVQSASKSVSYPSEQVKSTDTVCRNNDVALGESTTVKHVISEPACHVELNVVGASTAPISRDQNVDIPKESELKCVDDMSTQQLPGNVNVSASDEEKINLSADILEEDSYEYESDGNSVPMDIEEDGVGHNDYEDGEVQDQQLRPATEGPTANITQDIGSLDFYANQVNYTRNTMDVHLTSFLAKENDKHQEGSGGRSDDIAKESVVSQVDGRVTVIAGRLDSMEPSLAQLQAVGYVKQSPGRIMQGGSHDVSGKKDDPEGQSAEQSAVTFSGHENLSIVSQVSEDSTQTASLEKSGSALLNTEVPLTSDDAKDINNAVNNRARIINLPKASNMQSPDKSRSTSGKPFPSRPGRERLPDMSLDGDRFHSRGRDEPYNNDGSQRFSRERRHDHHYYRNNRLNFNRGRGRLPSRAGNRHGDMDPERDFHSDFYGGNSDFVPRHKGDTEFMKNIGPDGNFINNNGRGGRKIMDNETSMFRHLPSRRHSPGGRGIQMMHRVPRNIGEESSEVGLRHSDKIVRGAYPDDDDDIEHTFTRPQPPYKGVDGHFVQGPRNFSSMQRRGPQIHSKSPIRSRSPGPWSSSRRRSPGEFGGPPELSGRMSPPIYRMDRMRSPDHSSGFPEEMGVRRHAGSPPYLSRPNDMREMDPERNHHVHPRSMMSSNRSPNGRALLRNSRRFGPVDHREREGSDEFFGGPMQSGGRFHHDLGAADGDGEDRRRFSERRGPIRPFRSSFNDVEGENFHLNSEDGPSRPFRLFSLDNQAMQERDNLRDRELDRRMKNRPGNAPRRVRGMEEQEGNYRHGGQVYDDGFDDVTRVKRKRFD